MYAKVLIAELSKLVKICFKERGKLSFSMGCRGRRRVCLLHCLFAPQLRFPRDRTVSLTFLRCAGEGDFSFSFFNYLEGML